MDRKQLQNRLLNLLIKIDRLCSEQNINYTLHGGTLLGVQCATKASSPEMTMPMLP